MIFVIFDKNYHFRWKKGTSSLKRIYAWKLWEPLRELWGWARQERRPGPRWCSSRGAPPAKGWKKYDTFLIALPQFAVSFPTRLSSKEQRNIAEQRATHKYYIYPGHKSKFQLAPDIIRRSEGRSRSVGCSRPPLFQLENLCFNWKTINWLHPLRTLNQDENIVLTNFYSVNYEILPDSFLQRLLLTKVDLILNRWIPYLSLKFLES